MTYVEAEAQDAASLSVYISALRYHKLGPSSGVQQRIKAYAPMAVYIHIALILFWLIVRS